ncbi:glycosyltransferase family 2 protein [Haloplanus halobius]|uniref:glycosyltransferase family 2 protein n=1 Tax=Haloplanus halobius TaxID=2934938 RepID=UPI00200E2F69|nr:glycosyltransferase [Haloplanus sp. XH21]
MTATRSQSSRKSTEQDGVALSICIPTYNNAERLAKVIGHVLELDHGGVELVVCDDGSDDDTRAAIDHFDDERLRYFENETNIGYEKNLFRCLTLARGRYLMPLADEDKIVSENLRWALSLIENPTIEFSSIVAGYGPVDDEQYDWDESVPLMQECETGYDSLAAFVNRIPHPFANHTWRRNYIGGIILERSAIDLEAAEEYFGSLYIHNVLLIQAMVNGRAILSSRHLCLVDHYQYEGEHRFWSDFDWSDLELRVQLQQYRMKAVDEILRDQKSKDLFTRVETRFAAQLAAWATLQKDTALAPLKHAALNGDVRSLEDIWQSRAFRRRYIYYLVVLPLPIDSLKRDVQEGLIPRKSLRVWYHFVARILPSGIDERIRRWYANRNS